MLGKYRMKVSNNEESDESEEECMCECYEEECVCECECVDCDPDWLPDIDDSDSDYDSDDSMDYVYEECGLNRREKKILQEELRLLEEQAIMGTILEEEQEDPHPAK